MEKATRAAKIRLLVMLSLAAALCIFCIAAPHLMPNDPNHADLSIAKQPPGGNYPLGTDWLGRCVLSRILAGAPTSVFAALKIVLLTMSVGCAAGILGGYFGGAVDTILMRIVDIFLAFPGMVLALAVAGMLGKGLNNAIFALTAVGWPQYARLARSYVLSLRQENFVHAARLNGQSSAGILLRHILPNAVRPVIVTASLHIGGAIMELAGLSFLGLGAQPPAAEWGSMLSDGRGFLQKSPWLVLYPGLAIFVTSILFNLLGDSVRDVLDPQSSRHIFSKRGRKKKQMKKILSIFLAMLFLIGCLAGCTGNKNPAASDQTADTTAAGDSAQTAAASGLKDFTFGVYNFSKIDPADGYNGWGTIRYGVGETLFKLDDNLNVVAVLVTDYSLSDDQLTWTLTLRDGVKFHNGDTMDGAAVKASLERLTGMNERAASDLMIASMAADGNTLAITTTGPNPTLLNALCDPYACIVDAAADDGSGSFEMYPVCTGPYVVKEYEEDDHAYLEPFADYWGGTPASKSVTVKAISDVDTLAMAMQNGEIDAAYGLSYDTLDQFQADDSFEITQAATTRVYMLYFNLNHEFMNDENFRRAVCMAIDKESYGSVLLSGAGTATKAAFPSSLRYGDDSLMTDVPDYDAAGAKALLEENGYKDTDGDGYLDKDGKKVSLRLVTYGRTGLPQSAQALQSALTELGIDCSFEQYDSVEQVLTADDYDICAYAYVTTPTGDPLSYLSFTMGTGNGANFGHYSNAEVDDLLAQMSTQFDPAKRAELAVKIQQIATSDCSYCYMFHLNMFMVMKKGVSGIKQSPVDYYQITAQTAAA